MTKIIDNLFVCDKLDAVYVVVYCDPFSSAYNFRLDKAFRDFESAKSYSDAMNVVSPINHDLYYVRFVKLC